jgi:tetratricopeptide (TPR) repeat protein
MTRTEASVPIGDRRGVAGGARRLEESFARVVQASSGCNDLNAAVGMLAFRDGRLEDAVAALGQAVAMDPENADLHYYHAAAFLGLGKYDEARSGFQRVLEIRPVFPEAHNDLGNLLAMSGRLDEALACYRQALQGRPEFAEARHNLGVGLCRQGKFAEAESAFREALRLQPELPGPAKALAGVCARQGKLDEAVTLSRQGLKRQPDPETFNDLGITLARLGRHREAADAYREAIALKADFPDAHNNLGNALRNLGKLDGAIAEFREALRLRPRYPEAFNNAGIALKYKGKLDEAIASYQEALRLRPAYAEAHNNLGIALASRGKHDAAVISFRQAIRLKGDYVEALCNLANALNVLNQRTEAIAIYDRALKIRPDDPKLHKDKGLALARAEKLDEAIACYREAIRLKADFVEAHNDMGIALARQGKYDDAAASYRRAIDYRPNYAEAHNNLGNALRNAGKFTESLDCYQSALKFKPDYADAHNNLGIAYSEMGRFDDAVASYTQCIRIKPHHVDAHMNRALTWLRKGDYAQGWAEYEWRWRKRRLTNRPLIMPAWNGFPLNGRRILLFTEQGNGDVIQFVRFARRLKEQGGTVILECPERLVKLLSGCPYIDQLVPQGAPLPDYDVYAPLLTLPGLLATSLESIPVDVPYLHPEPELVERWRERFAGIRELKVGINWQGNPKYAGDRHRSIPLRHFESLARVPGVRLYSLQKNAGLEQLKELTGTFEVEDLGSALDETTGPFQETAALMRNLDLFITSDTAVAHLAGALGVPVWMAVSTTPDWRWLTAREDNPWYPSMRIFRQTTHMDWVPVFERMAVELRKLAPPTVKAPAVRIDVSPGELIDKITILEIKGRRFQDADKLKHVQIERELLRAALDRAIVPSDELTAVMAELQSVNEALWQIEEDIRDRDRAGDFGPQFVALAQSVYRTNDHRAALKRRINALLHAEVIEEKDYGKPSE